MGRVAPAPATLHLPFGDGPFRMAMGLTAIADGAWLEIDDRHVAQIAERQRLLATRRDEVFAAGAATSAARDELLAVLAAHLPQVWPEWFRRDGSTLHNLLAGTRCHLDRLDDDPLAVAARLVQEDFLLLVLTPDGPVLDSGLLCFPARWRLREKLGRPLLAVHAGVPLYADRLGRPVDRFMTALKPGRVAMRQNWSVVDDPTLFQPTGHGRTVIDTTITPGNAGERLFLRVERQSFRLLPQSNVVVFGINTHVTPLAVVAALPGEAARLAAAVRALPEELARYKSLPPFSDALLRYLDAG